MIQAYLKMVGRRIIRWGTGGGVAIIFFVAAAAIGLPDWGVLVAGVIGALVGSVVSFLLMQRLFGSEPPVQQAPPGRGSGRRGS
jgi:hypothetical protein